MSAEYERSFFDYLYVVVKWRRMIAVAAIAVGVVAAGISLVLPKAWTADVKLLPPEEDSFDQLSLSVMTGASVPSSLMGLVGSNTPSDRLVTMLASRRVLGAVVDRFGLVRAYGARDRVEAMDILNENIETDVQRDGTLVLFATFADPDTSALLANALTAQLDTVNRDYKRQQAAATRMFLEGRVSLMEQELRDNGRSLQVFQDRHGLVDLETQTTASVEVVRSIVQQLAELEVELGVAEQQLKPDHEQRQILELEAATLQRQLSGLYGTTPQPAFFKSLGPPLKQLPTLMQEYTELTLGVKIREEILHFLGTKLEESKYREALNTPTIQVLDRAIVPTVRSAPRRTMIVVAAFAVSLILSTVLAFVFESWTRLQSTDREKVDSIRQLLR